MCSEPAPTGEAFDILVTDGTQRYKMALSTAFCDRVMRAELRVGMLVRINRLRICFDALQFQPVPFGLVTDLTVIDPDYQIEFDESELKYPAGSTGRQLYCVPLTKLRNCYVSLFTDNEFPLDDSRWDDKVPNMLLNENFTKDFPRIGDVVQTAWQTATPRKTKSVSSDAYHLMPLVGRVLEKSSFSFYGVHNGPEDEKPYKFIFVLGDDSGQLSCTVWNHATIVYFKHVNVGDIVVLPRYTLKADYLDPSKTEVAINFLNLKTVLIHKLTAENFVGWTAEEYRSRFPYFVPRIVGKSEQEELENESTFFIVGKIIHQGETEFEQTATGGRFSFKWLKLQDGLTDSSPMILKLYSCSDPFTFEALEIGDVLRTQVRLHSFVSEAVGVPESFLATTAMSQLEVIPPHEVDHEKFPFLNDVPFSTRGGYLQFLPGLNSVEDLEQSYTDLKPVLFADLDSIVGSLPILASKLVLIHGDVGLFNFGSLSPNGYDAKSKQFALPDNFEPSMTVVNRVAAVHENECFSNENPFFLPEFFNNADSGSGAAFQPVKNWDFYHPPSMTIQSLDRQQKVTVTIVPNMYLDLSDFNYLIEWILESGASCFPNCDFGDDMLNLFKWRLNVNKYLISRKGQRNLFLLRMQRYGTHRVSLQLIKMF